MIDTSVLFIALNSSVLGLQIVAARHAAIRNNRSSICPARSGTDQTSRLSTMAGRTSDFTQTTSVGLLHLTGPTRGVALKRLLERAVGATCHGKRSKTEIPIREPTARP